MPVAEACAGVLLAAGALLLLVAGAGHLRHRARLAIALAAHRLMPAAWARPLGRALPACELGLGLSVALSSSHRGPLPAALALSQGILYAAMAGYVAVLLRVRPGADCGCAASEAPANWLTVGRAAVLAAGALAAGWAAADLPPASAPPPPLRLAAVWMLAAMFAVVLWVAPGTPLPPARPHTRRGG